jgi:hypothetical protein
MCSACNIKFTVKYDGKKAVKTHLKSKKHESLTKTIAGNQLLIAFIPKKKTYEELKI